MLRACTASGLALAVLVLAACPSPRATRRPVDAGFTGCLPLAGTSRSALRLGPDGRHLYWSEQVRLHGYEHAWPETAVVRWPLAGGEPELLTGLLDRRYRVLPDGRLVGIRTDDDGGNGVAVWSPYGSELVSLTGRIDHLELLPGEEAVIYRDGSSLYRQPVHRQAARWLAYADVLLGVDGGDAIVRNVDGEGRHLQRIDGASGKVTELPWHDSVIKAVPGALVIKDRGGLSVRPLDGGQVVAVLPGEDWQARAAGDAVTAWRRMGPRLDAAIVTAAGADRLPPVLGGDSLEGFVRLPDGRVAYLVGHDLDGDDEVGSGDEVDVCLAAGTAREARVTPRRAPARWRAAGEAVAALVKERLGGGRWYFAAGDKVPGVYVKAGASGRSDDAVRADVRALAAAVAAGTGDATMFVDIAYADDRHGYGEWWSATGRRVAWTGVGGATVPALDDYDVVITTEELASTDDDDGLARCRGTVKNTSDRTLVELVADCVAGVDDEPIDVIPPTLAPGQVGRYEGVVRREGGATLAVSIHTGNGRDEVPGFEQSRHDRLSRVAAVATELADRTDLVYRSVDLSGEQVTVHLEARKAFVDATGADKELRAAAAAGELERLGAVLLGAGDHADLQRRLRGEEVDLDDDHDLRLRITGDDRAWWWEDGELTGPGID